MRAEAVEPVPADARPPHASSSGPIFSYFGPFTLLVWLAMPHGYFLDIATSFMLKNQLHASATQVSTFRLLTAIPVYVSFLFGLARDLWNPFGLKDRGFLLLFAPISAALFVWMAFAPLDYGSLLGGLLLVMISFRFVTAAYWGLLALVGQEQLMSGRLSVLWNLVSTLPYVAGAFFSGYLTQHLSPREIFLLAAALALSIVLPGLWRPPAVFGHLYDQPQARGAGLFVDIKRLLAHRAVYPAVLIAFLFQFAPGSNTPLQFYLTDVLHASDAIYGYYYAIFFVSFFPMYLLYAYLCRRVSLNKLLWWGTVITIPQMIPLAFVHSANQAMLMAVPIGLMGGIAITAYYDLAMRACPAGLQGTLMMMVDGVYLLSYRGGDLLGSWIYARSPTHGFLYCVLVTASVYALILPVLLLVPKELTATADG